MAATEDMLVDTDDGDLLRKIPLPSSKIEPRSMFIQLNALESYRGSAYMEYGHTKIMAFVQPPRKVTNQKRNNEIPCQINCALTFIPKVLDDLVLLKDRSGIITKSLEKVLESSICRQQYTNMQLDIKVTVLEDDGCVLSTAINCCGAALVVAGIPTYDLITASTVGYYKGAEYFNPDAISEKLFKQTNQFNSKNRNYGILTVSSFPSFNQVTGCIQKGLLSRSALGSMLSNALEINDQISQSIKHALLENVKKVIAFKEESNKKNEIVED